MDKLRITGGRTLQGEVTISGAKNAALPELCAALLTADPVTLNNVPRLRDVATMRQLLDNMGVQTQTHGERGGITLQAADPILAEAPYELVKTMRASVLVLGPLLARFGHARVSLPGGCAIGSRPVDQHIKGMQAMGAEIVVEHGYMVAKLPAGKTRLHGARIATDMVTVTGTENFLMAAALAEGETLLENAAQEPEIGDLAEMLIAMGAKIEGHGTSRIHIQGVDRLHGCTHQVVADRIETGTFLCAVAATGGDVVLRHGRADHLDAVIDKLHEAGAEIEAGKDAGGDFIRVRASGRLKAQSFRTTEYPGFPDRHAGPVHGAQLHRRRHEQGHRDHLREPLHARQRTGAPGCAHPDRRQDRRGRGHPAAVGRHRHGHRPARLGQPGDCRSGGRG